MVKQAHRYCVVSLDGAGKLGGDHRVTVFAFYASGWRFVWVIPCYRSVHPPSTALSSRDLPPKWESPPHAYCMWGWGLLIYATPLLHRQSRALAAAWSSTRKVRKSTQTFVLVPLHDRWRLKRLVWGFKTNRLAFYSTEDPKEKCKTTACLLWRHSLVLSPSRGVTGCRAHRMWCVKWLKTREGALWKGGGSSLTRFV